MPDNVSFGFGRSVFLFRYGFLCFVWAAVGCTVLGENQLAKKPVDGSSGGAPPSATGSSGAGGFEPPDASITVTCTSDIQNDVDNCGACGNACSFANASAVCRGGQCTIGACVAPFLDCNLMLGDGCEANVNEDPHNCGGCGKDCALPHAKTTCTAGACTIDSCQDGYADCDGEAANGCEVSLATSPTSCGACGHVCITNHAAANCVAGLCVVLCDPGYADCDANAGDGCEVSTQTNVNNCGACGKVCPMLGGAPTCLNGACGVSMCSAGRGDCDGNPGNGCEVDLLTDAKNCGGCGVQCFAANGTALCVGGVCTVASCNAGYANCNGLYSDGCEASLTTLVNCGACSAPCGLAHATASCASGSCKISSCTAPWADCDGLDSTGCEVDTSSNAANCGACGKVCTVSGGSPACTAMNCTIASCTPPFADCDTKYATGCEINTQTSAANCGACGHACPASFACQSGACHCNADADCNAGTPGSCMNGFCKCGMTTCLEGNRCQANGSCG